MITKYLFLLTIFLIPLYLVKIELFSLPSNILEFLILVVFFVYSIELFFKKKLYSTFVLNIKKIKSYICIIAFLLLGLFFSAFLSNNISLSELGILKGWFFFPLLFSFLLYTQKNIIKTDLILLSIFLSILIVSFIALTYYAFDIITYDNRLKAFYLSPNHLGMYLAPGFFIGLYFIKKHSQFKKALFFSVGLILLTIYLTFSYATWASLLVAFLGIKLLSFKKTCFNISYILRLLLILSFLILFLLFTQSDSNKLQALVSLNERSSLASRIIIWKSSIAILQDNWLWGIGPGNFETVYLNYQKYFSPYLEWAVPQPHNLYLAFWLQSGLIGLLSFLFLLFTWFKKTFSTFFITKNHFFYETIIGIMFYILLHGLLDTPYWKNDLALIFWIIIILGITNQRKIT